MDAPSKSSPFSPNLPQAANADIPRIAAKFIIGVGFSGHTTIQTAATIPLSWEEAFGAACG